MAEHRPNVFVVGLDDYQRTLLERLPRRDEVRVHPLLPMERLRGVSEYDLEALLDEARAELAAFDGTVDGITTFIDFPALEIAAILAAERGLPGPGLEGLLSCSHKYWSRRLQRAAVGEHVPPFAAFDPFDPAVVERLEETLSYPFWIKPINAYRSHLGFRVGNRRQLKAALPRLQEGIGRLADPLARVLDHARLPAEVQGLSPTACLAEGIIGGRQFTVEGWILGGEPRVYGIVDSVREPNRVSFARYEYPSRLPRRVREAATAIANRAVAASRLDTSPFNAEFFWDPRRDRLHLLEINPRISESHCELFEKVDGASHQQVALDLALGRAPAPPHREGAWPRAGKFFVRAFHDATVRHVPSPAEVAAVERDLPGTTIRLRVHDHEALDRLQDQDSYSYELAWVWIAGRDSAELRRRYAEIRRRLGIEMSDNQEVV